MARLFSSGFELNSAVSLMEWTTVTVVNVPTIDATTKRSGGFAMRIQTVTGSAVGGMNRTFTATPAAGPYYARFYLRIATAPGATTTIFFWEDDTTVGEATGGGQIKLTTGRILQLFNSTTQIGSDSAALSLDTWYRIECLYDATPAGGNQVLRAYIDGVEFAGAATLTIADVTVNTIGIGTNLDTEAASTGDWYFDDVAVNDSTGTVQTGLPGEGKIVHIHPSAAGDNAAPTGTFEDVNEVTPDDATTKIDLNNIGDIADYNCEASSVPGIVSSDTITLIEVGVRLLQAGASSYQLRIKSAAGGTTTSSTASAAVTSNYKTNPLGTTEMQHRLVSYLDPTTGVAWTPTGTNSIDNMQIGISSGDADDLDVSTLWALVEYVLIIGIAFDAASNFLMFMGPQPQQ